MSQELTVFSLVEMQESFFAPVLSDESITWEKEKQFAIQFLQSNEFLATTAMKNQTSLQNAIINVASIGISLNPAAKHAYLVPRDGKVCLDISYMGLLHLAMSTGAIKWGQCKIVYSNDSYQNNGLDLAPTHNYNAFGDRGEIVGAYCSVKTSEGDFLTDEMSIADINKIMNLSKSAKSKYSPWNGHFNEMARKTVVKRAAKYWPTVERLHSAIHHLNTDSDEGLDLTNQEVIDVTPIGDDELSNLKDAIENSGRKEADFCKWATRMFKRDITEVSSIQESEYSKSLNMVANA